MVEFQKNAQKCLPYYRTHYIEYLDDDFKAATEWNGLSFQLDVDKIGIAKALEVIEPFFKSIISKLDTNVPWVINHDERNMEWLPWEKNDLPNLRALFKQNNIPPNWKGAIVLMKDDLFKLADDLLVYSYGTPQRSYKLKNLDISHSTLQFIVKITHDLDINLLSTDKPLLKKFGDEYCTGDFVMKQYRGTSLWS